MARCGERCRSFGLAIFNPKEKTFCGRTCKSWTLILIYYCFFYSVLAAFWFGMLSVLIYAMTNENSPRLTGMQSLLKLTPGMGIVPPIDSEDTLMQITVFDSKLKQNYLDFMENYLKNYSAQSSTCNFETGERYIPVTESCKFPISLLGPCSDPAAFLNTNSNVCFYLKLNKIYGFLPDIEGNKIHVDCGPANAFDGPNLGRPVFYPSVTTQNGTYGYFSSVVFPYLNQPDYQVPLLAVTFPEIKRNTVVMVSCNVVNMKSPESFRFDVAIDTDKSIALS